eukprot:TRINITY_DN1888_c0_g1_i3.p2 TRINITY_DN1888_c0_g1~~TRINITY_DN1888_c0_g1_i3.p2  ORF type:complete len:150 (-),score=34.94 TRINITY_DN1888_c0_g1_i3:120-569(-)
MSENRDFSTRKGIADKQNTKWHQIRLHPLLDNQTVSEQIFTFKNEDNSNFMIEDDKPQFKKKLYENNFRSLLSMYPKRNETNDCEESLLKVKSSLTSNILKIISSNNVENTASSIGAEKMETINDCSTLLSDYITYDILKPNRTTNDNM